MCDLKRGKKEFRSFKGRGKVLYKSTLTPSLRQEMAPPVVKCLKLTEKTKKKMLAIQVKAFNIFKSVPWIIFML